MNRITHDSEKGLLFEINAVDLIGLENLTVRALVQDNRLLASCGSFWVNRLVPH